MMFLGSNWCSFLDLESSSYCDGDLNTSLVPKWNRALERTKVIDKLLYSRSQRVICNNLFMLKNIVVFVCLYCTLNKDQDPFLW